jgi:hypothetical protein
MKISNLKYSEYRNIVSKKLARKNNSLQFLPKVLDSFSTTTHIEYKGQKLKTSYFIDIVHNLMLKYYFKKDNKFVINAQILKDRYGYLYNYYIQWLVENNILYLICNYKAGKNSRIYSLNEIVFRQKIKRYKNSDKVLIKKYKKKIFETIDFVDDINSRIEPFIREKLISDLFFVDIEFERSIFYLDMLKKEDIDIYNRNIYSVESINDKHIFYHFDNYGRMHTNFTILKSFIRKNCLLIDGMSTCELDIKNSQPLFLCKLIHDSDTKWVKEDEFKLFKQLTTSGKYYQYIMQVTGEKDKKLVKELTYKVLFGRNSQNNKADKVFSQIFPTIYNFIKLYKKENGDYKILAHDLQRAESNLIYNKIIKKINLIYPDIKIVTVHDSIIFPNIFKDQVEQIFESEIISEFDLD